MWAIVPLKSPLTAKSRLSAVLSADQRRDLFFELARRVIVALRATPGIAQVAVVTASDDVARFAGECGAVVLRQSRDAGTAQAFAAAIAQLRPLHIGKLLMIAGDLPLISSHALEPLLAAAAHHDIVIVPDRLGVGTNALLCSPPDAIAPCFGADSFGRHLAAARATDLTHRVLHIDELALDIDVPADLEHLKRLQGGAPPGRPKLEAPLTLAGGHA